VDGRRKSSDDGRTRSRVGVRRRRGAHLTTAIMKREKTKKKGEKV